MLHVLINVIMVVVFKMMILMTTMIAIAPSVLTVFHRHGLTKKKNLLNFQENFVNPSKDDSVQ